MILCGTTDTSLSQNIFTKPHAEHILMILCGTTDTSLSQNIFTKPHAEHIPLCTILPNK